MFSNIARQAALIVSASAFVTSIAFAQRAATYAPGMLHYHVTTVSTRTQPLGGGRAPFDFTTPRISGSHSRSNRTPATRSRST